MSAYSFSDLVALWKRNGGNPVYAPMAAAVALAESGGNPGATNKNGNGSVDRGLWQINSVHGSLSTTDVNRNAKAAIEISNNGTNWRPWCTAWSDGKCGGTFLGKSSPVFAHLPAGSDTGSTSGTQSNGEAIPALKAVQAAYSQIGLPYVFGAEAPGKDFDCSGLTQYAYRKAGITIPRTAAAQQAATQRISRAELRPGDLIFWGNPAHHVAIYIGGGYLIQAPQSGEKVDRVKVWGTPSNYGRVNGSGAGGTSGDLVQQGDSTKVTGAAWGGSLNPANWPGELYDQVIKPIGWAFMGAAGVGMMIIGVAIIISGTRTGQQARRVGVAAATRGAYVPPPPKPKPAPKRVVSRETSPAPVPKPAPADVPRRRAARRPMPTRNTPQAESFAKQYGGRAQGNTVVYE